MFYKSFNVLGNLFESFYDSIRQYFPNPKSRQYFPNPNSKNSADYSAEFLLLLSHVEFFSCPWKISRGSFCVRTLITTS